MTDCPDWCHTPDDGHTVHEALWHLHDGMPVLITRDQDPPLLELNARPTNAQAVSIFVMDALTYLTSGATIVINVQPDDG